MEALLKTGPLGDFTSVLPKAPDRWPWALPHIYAINLFSEPAVEVCAASASPDGEYVEKTELNEDRTIIEQVGFWHGTYALLDSFAVLKKEAAMEEARHLFALLPVRYVMEQGAVVETNELMEITGEWPDLWRFNSFNEIGSYCAYLFEKLQGADEATAVTFRESLHFAMPGTELIVMYIDALTNVQSSVERLLPSIEDSRLKLALDSLRSRLPGYPTF